MAAVIGALRAELSASIAKFQADMRKASNAVRTFASDVQRDSQKFIVAGESMTRMARTLGAALSAAAAIGFARRMLQNASSLDEQAAQLNIGVEALQAYRGASLTAGVSTEQMEKFVARLADALGEAISGDKAAQKALAALGVTQDQYSKGVENAITVIAQHGLAMKAAGREVQLSTALNDAAGKGAYRLATAFNDLALPIDQLIARAKELGIVLDAELARKADEAADKMALAWMRFEAATAVYVVSFTSQIADFIDGYTRLEAAARDSIAVQIQALKLAYRVGQFTGRKVGQPPSAPVGEETVTVTADRPAVRSTASRPAAAQDERGRLFDEAPTQKLQSGLTEAAEAMADAASSLQKQLSTAQQIGDLQRTLGFGAPISAGQEALQAKQRELDTERAASLVRIRELEKEITAATLEGKTERLEGLNAELSIAQQLDALLGATSAEQLIAAQRINDAFKNLTDSLSSSLSTMLMEWEFDVESLKNVFKQFINELLIKPAISEGVGLLSGLLKGVFTGGASGLEELFEGGHAEGGFIRPGRWGIAGENGAEAVFGGRMGASVMAGGGGSRGGDTYIDMRGADVAAVKRLEGFVRSQARGERERWKVHFAENTGSRPR